MESSSTIPLTVVLSILTSFLFQHIRLLTKLKNGTYLANIEKEYRVRASATYDMGLDTYGTITSQRGSSTFHALQVRVFSINAVDRIAYFMLECIQGKFILDKNVCKSPVKYVFSATSSTSIFVPKNETYDDTRRSCRNYYVLQGTQSNL